jgi:hypothetical protein
MLRSGSRTPTARPRLARSAARTHGLDGDLLAGNTPSESTGTAQHPLNHRRVRPDPGSADADERDHLQTVSSSVITRAMATGMPIGVHAASGAQATRYTEQGATITTAAVDDSALTDTVGRHLGLARASRPGTRTASAESRRFTRHRPRRPGKTAKMALAVRVLTAAVVCAVVMAALAWMLQRRLIYLPTGHPAAAPEQVLEGGSAVVLRRFSWPALFAATPLLRCPPRHDRETQRISGWVRRQGGDDVPLVGRCRCRASLQPSMPGNVPSR